VYSGGGSGGTSSGGLGRTLRLGLSSWSGVSSSDFGAPLLAEGLEIGVGVGAHVGQGYKGEKVGGGGKRMR
jgi:hypothetical protein